MSATHDDLVDIQVLGDVPPVTRAGFGVPMIVDAASMSERIRFYTTAAAAAADQTAGDITAAQLAAINAAFAQQPRPRRVAAGRAAAEVAQVTTVTVGGTAVTGDYSFEVTPFGETTPIVVSFTATVPTDTNDTIGAGLRAAATAALTALYGIVVTGATTSIILTGPVGEAFVVDNETAPGTGTLAAVTDTPALALSTELDAILAESGDWYGFVMVSRAKLTHLHAAAWVESKKRIYGAQTNDADVLTTATDDVASLLQDLAYNRTFVIYHSPGSQHAAFAWMSKALAWDMDSQRQAWDKLTLTGISPIAITETQKGNAQGKNVSLYMPLFGTSVVSPGKMASGRFIDTQVLIDWTQARTSEAVAQLLIREANAGRPVPYSDQGFSQVADAIQGVLDLGLEIGHFRLSDAGIPPFVDVPLLAEVDPADKAARILRLTFYACETGSVLQVLGTGYVTVDDTGFNQLAVDAGIAIEV